MQTRNQTVAVKYFRWRFRLSSLLLSWPFLLALSILLFNDNYLKYAYSGVVSGKLSDFAGLFVVSVLLYGLYPKHRLTCTAALVMGFIYWKSPLSQPLIDVSSHVFQLRIGRVVDYTDLIAFVVLPLSSWFVSGRLASPSSGSFTQLPSVFVSAIAIVAITGTSMLMPMKEFVIRDASSSSNVQVEDIYKAVESLGERYSWSCAECDARASHNTFSGKDLVVMYWLDESDGDFRFLVQLAKAPTFMWSDFDYDLLDNATLDLKREFAKLSSEMEYVELLSQPPYQ